MKKGYKYGSVPSGDNWTNAELFTILNDPRLEYFKKTRFENGNIEDFLEALK